MDANQIYSYHFYAWFGERRKQQALQSIIKTLNSKLPLWCGEWGEDTPENLRGVRAAIKALPNDAGMSFWTWKRVSKQNNHFPFYRVNVGAEWQKVINWATGWKIFKPNRTEVKKGTEDFLKAIQAENSVFNRNTKNALGF